MKITICDKGEGYVVARFEAESNIETLILSTVALTSARTHVSLDSPGHGYPPKGSVGFGSFAMPTHEIIDKQAPRS